jgi:hypothetical protein
MTNNNDGADDLTRVTREVASRLERLGIRLDGSERPDDLTQLSEAVERFEAAVESHGGDLMVDEAPRGEATEPDNPNFGLPLRKPHEPIQSYIERLARATDTVQRHGR